ncbi:heart- and neural crest derivatives-expressed protein 1-like [Onthophagus taurus]|uniref:heart- and neural crest derivatives-expressed protein 1-like n=1 Tax=Onthophagus taurus TaxID=166361 RepID=UPI000C20D993|nr:uncharacterized protein LOC111425299 [Onthophagus taurus]
MSFANGNDGQDVYHYSSYGPPQTMFGHSGFVTDGSNIGPSEESNFWSSSPRSDSPSPSGPIESPVVGPYQIYTPITYSQNDCHSKFKQTYNVMSQDNDMDRLRTPYIRVVKRRNTANKKERRRTQSINNAYADLRDCIPNVPADTKLSKIKTLRLATSYISYLTEVLETDDPAGGFRAELTTHGRKSTNSSHIQVNECTSGQISPKSDTSEDMISTIRRAKGRTGWPQHVWALELKQEQPL